MHRELINYFTVPWNIPETSKPLLYLNAKTAAKNCIIWIGIKTDFLPFTPTLGRFGRKPTNSLLNKSLRDLDACSLWWNETSEGSARWTFEAVWTFQMMLGVNTAYLYIGPKELMSVSATVKDLGDLLMETAMKCKMSRSLCNLSCTTPVSL